MTKMRLVAPVALLSALVVAACAGTTGSSGSPAASVPAASPSAAASTGASASADASASAGASGSAGASASASAGASSGASADAGGGDLAAKIPATVGDVAMSATVIDGESYVKANVNRQLAPILTALNKTPTDVTVATATGSIEGGATLFIDAVQVSGADAAAMVTAFQTAATASPGTTVEAADVGGKQVVTATTTSYTLAVYGSGDTIFYVQSPDAELVDQAIAALP
jgi:hypothetical protein